MKNEPIFMEPEFKDYIWGGQKLKKIFNKNVRNQECTAESWEISANPNGESIIKNGDYAGKKLSEIYSLKNIRKEIFGTKCEKIEEFPVLIKFIDASTSLSVQVHPNDEYARKNENSNGKTEMWYILECEAGAQIICGVKPGIDKDKLKEKVNEGKISECLNYIDVKKGDAIYIPSGTIHALLGKTLVAEIQQNSNITYRVYDWDRLGKDGKPRELHIKKALDVIDINKKPQIKNIDNVKEKINIVNSQYFNTDKINVKNTYSEEISNESFVAMNVIEGNGKLVIDDISYKLVKGDSFIIPACVEKYELQGKIEVIKTTI